MADLIIRDLTPSQLAAVTGALAKAGVDFETSAPIYTVAEAQALYTDLNEAQRDVLRQVVEWGGVLTTGRLRDDAGGSLRGKTGPITKAVQRLVLNGTLRAHLTNPVTTVYDPSIRGRQRTHALKMGDENVAAFSEGMRAADSAGA